MFFFFGGGGSDLIRGAFPKLWSQVLSLPIEFNGNKDHSYLTMVLRNAPLKTPMLNLPPLHPQNVIDFNPLTCRTLAGAEPEKDELRKKKNAQFILNNFQCFQPNKVYFRFQTFKYMSIK